MVATSLATSMTVEPALASLAFANAVSAVACAVCAVIKADVL